MNTSIENNGGYDYAQYATINITCRHPRGYRIKAAASGF